MIAAEMKDINYGVGEAINCEKKIFFEIPS